MNLPDVRNLKDPSVEEPSGFVFQAGTHTAHPVRTHRNCPEGRRNRFDLPRSTYYNVGR